LENGTQKDPTTCTKKKTDWWGREGVEKYSRVCLNQQKKCSGERKNGATKIKSKKTRLISCQGGKKKKESKKIKGETHKTNMNSQKKKLVGTYRGH